MKLKKEQKNKWKNKFNWKNISTYRRIVVLLLIISIPNLVIGLITYVFGASTIRAHLIENHESQIINQIEFIDSQFQDLEMNLNFTSHESLFNEDFSEINFQVDYHLAQDIADSLVSKQYGNALIERMHFFIDGPRPIVFNTEFRWVNASDAQIYRNYINDEDDFFWERNLLKESDDTHIFPLVLVKHLNPYINPNSNNVGFIIELNQEAVTQQLNSLSLSEDGLSFFIDEGTGLIISNTGTSQYMEDFILSESMDEDTRFISWNNQEYSMISGNISRVNNNWRYVSLVPVSDIIQPVTTLSAIIIVSSIVGILLSLLISILSLNRLFKPIRNMYHTVSVSNDEINSYDTQKLEEYWTKMNDEKKLLSDQVEELKDDIIGNVFFKFINDHYNYAEYDEIEDKLIKFGMNPTKNRYIYLDTRAEGKVNRNLLTKLLQFNLEEVYHISFNEKYSGYVIHHELEDDTYEKLELVFQEFENKLVRYNDEAVEIYISVSSANLRELREAIKEIAKVKYRRSQSQDILTIIDMATIESATEKEIVTYPYDIEKEILDRMRFGNQYEIEELIDRFSQRLTSLDRRLVQDYFIQLYTSINQEIINQNVVPYEIVSKENPIKIIINSQKIKDIKNLLLNNILLPFFDQKENKEDDKKVQAIKETIDYIELHYNEDISLEECADRVDVNPYTLSKWFKEINGINFIDYLTDFRIDKAKDLLANSDLKIGEIAEAIGYQSNYFNRIFKKYTGETPGKYRSKFK